MTPEERAAALGDVFERHGDDVRVEVWRSEIAAAIRAAVEEEREAVAARLEKHARTLVERADADPLTEKYVLKYRQAARNAAVELTDAALLTREGR